MRSLLRSRTRGSIGYQAAAWLVAGWMALGNVGQAEAASPVNDAIRVPCVLGHCDPGLALHFIGEYDFPWDYRYQGILLGGLSGIDYDSRNGRYVAISDDRSEVAPSRFYQLAIDVADNQLKHVAVTGVTPFRNPAGKTYPRQRVDPESIRVGPNDQVYWGSEGHPELGTPAEITVSQPNGDYVRNFTIPAAFAPHRDGSSGVRSNLSFEGISFAPNGDLFVSTEGTLQQDGPNQSIDHGALLRFLRFDSSTGKAKAQYAYPVEPIPVASDKGAASEDSGVSEIFAVDNDHLLVVERSYAHGYGNTVRVYAATTRGATDIAPIFSLQQNKQRIVPMRKQLILDLGAQGIRPDNIEGVTLGRSREGKPLLIFIADDNFNPHQKTQILVFGIDHWPWAGGQE